MKKKIAGKASLIISVLVIALLPLLFTTCACESEIPTQEEAKTAVMEKFRQRMQHGLQEIRWYF